MDIKLPVVQAMVEFEKQRKTKWIAKFGIFRFSVSRFKIKIDNRLIANAPKSGQVLIGTLMDAFQSIFRAKNEFDERGKSLLVAKIGVSNLLAY